MLAGLVWSVQDWEITNIATVKLHWMKDEGSLEKYFHPESPPDPGWSQSIDTLLISHTSTCPVDWLWLGIDNEYWWCSKGVHIFVSAESAISYCNPTLDLNFVSQKQRIKNWTSYPATARYSPPSSSLPITEYNGVQWSQLLNCVCISNEILEHLPTEVTVQADFLSKSDIPGLTSGSLPAIIYGFYRKEGRKGEYWKVK